jgi:hypothetical protein
MLQLRGRGTGAMIQNHSLIDRDRDTSVAADGIVDKYLQKELKLNLYNKQQLSLVVYFERDVRSTEGNFVPKVQTKNITKVFKKVNVKKEIKNQTINALSDRLKNVKIQISNDNSYQAKRKCKS